MSAAPSCFCEKCASLCRRNPGWMTPDEAEAAINAGMQGRLMQDWIDPDISVGNDEMIFVLGPACVGHEGDMAPATPDDFFTAWFWEKGRCTFLTAQDLCEIHDSGFKPVECREASGCQPRPDFDRDADLRMFAEAWGSERGLALMERWDALMKVPA